MANFKALLSGFRQAEAHFEKQLAGITAAISSLEFGGAASPSVPGPGTHRHRRCGWQAPSHVSRCEGKDFRGAEEAVGGDENEEGVLTPTGPTRWVCNE